MRRAENRLLVSETLDVSPPDPPSRGRLRAVGRRPSPLPEFYGEKPVWWFALSVVGVDWHFGFVSEETIARVFGRNKWAGCMHTHRWVIFDRALPADNPSIFREVYLHEIDHIPFGQPAVARRLFGGASTKEADDREEAFVETHSAALAPALFSAGLLRMPRLPKGVLR
jgi:hypothetical protein